MRKCNNITRGHVPRIVSYLYSIRSGLKSVLHETPHGGHQKNGGTLAYKVRKSRNSAAHPDKVGGRQTRRDAKKTLDQLPHGSILLKALQPTCKSAGFPSKASPSIGWYQLSAVIGKESGTIDGKMGGQKTMQLVPMFQRLCMCYLWIEASYTFISGLGINIFSSNKCRLIRQISASLRALVSLGNTNPPSADQLRSSPISVESPQFKNLFFKWVLGSFWKMFARWTTSLHLQKKNNTNWEWQNGWVSNEGFLLTYTPIGH